MKQNTQGFFENYILYILSLCSVFSVFAHCRTWQTFFYLLPMRFPLKRPHLPSHLILILPLLLSNFPPTLASPIFCHLFLLFHLHFFLLVFAFFLCLLFLLFSSSTPHPSCSLPTSQEPQLITFPPTSGHTDCYYERAQEIQTVFRLLDHEQPSPDLPERSYQRV